MSKVAAKPESKVTEKQYDEAPRYELTEPFYDNLVLHDIGDLIEWQGDPSPSMIPLNAAAEDRHAKVIADYEAKLSRSYSPPLSELPDTLDGRVTVQGFQPGMKPSVRGKKVPAHTPLSHNAGKGAVKLGSQDELMSREITQKEPKNFDRVAR